MADDPPTEAPEWLRIIAEQRDLTRALARVPVLARGGLVRAVQSMPSPPTGATTEPAGVFAPDTHRDET